MQYQILRTKIIRIVRRPVRRITNEILRVKRLMDYFSNKLPIPQVIRWTFRQLLAKEGWHGKRLNFYFI